MFHLLVPTLSHNRPLIEPASNPPLAMLQTITIRTWKFVASSVIESLNDSGMDEWPILTCGVHGTFVCDSFFPSFLGGKKVDSAFVSAFDPPWRVALL